MDSASRLIQDGGTARVADVAEIEHDLLGRLVVAGGVLENQISARRIDSEFIDSAATAAKYGSISYGFPVSYATVALFYNKDLLPKAPASFEELIASGNKLTNKKEHRYALLWDIQNYYESRMFITLYGAKEFGANGDDAKNIGIASELAQKGLTAMKKLKAISSSNPNDTRDPQVRRGLFNEGKVAAVIDGPWAIQGYNSSGINYGVVPLPTYDGHHPRSFSTVRLAVVSSWTEFPHAAQLFADYLTSEKMLMKRYEMTKSIPPLQKLLNAIKTNADEPTRAIIAQGFYSDAMPAIPEMSYLWTTMASAITDVWMNDKPAKEVLTNTQSIIEEQISFQE